MIGEDSIFAAIPAETRFFLHLGDTIYADRDPPNATTLADYRTQHRAALAGADVTTQNYKALRARMPVFTTWDDHDLANDFSAGTGSALYAPAKQAFQEYQARANPDSLTAGELYYAFQYGDVGFFVTDGRSFRSADSATDNSSKTLLGATQKAALKNWLLTNKDTLKLKFICSSTPAHGYAANTGGDSWGGVDDGIQSPNGANGFRTERNEIWDYIDANQIPGVVIISGDQHWAGSFKTAYAGRPRYEFMSTPLNMTNTTSFMLNEVARAADPVNGPVLWKLDKTMNVGVVSVDTTVSPATVSFQLYGTGGSLGASYLTSISADDINTNLVPAPAVTLSATFPSSPHVGDTVNFDVTATLVGGATGALTVNVDQLPAGLTLGSTSQVDATHFKATVSGTLTTVQDIAATFGATGGSVAATPLVHEFNVQAAVTASYWNPANFSSHLLLSNSNKTETRDSAADGWYAGRAVTGNRPSDDGARYFEIHVDAMSIKHLLGFSSNTLDQTNYIGGDSVSAGWHGSAGQYYYNKTGKTAPLGTYAAGDVLMFAVSASGHLFFGKNGAWDGDPVADTGYAYALGVGATTTWYPAASTYHTGDAVTLRVLASEFSYAPPTGYSSWSGS